MRGKKKTVFKFRFHAAAGVLLAALLIMDGLAGCTPKKTAQPPHGTPEYAIELPPGYEDLRVIEQTQPAQSLPGDRSSAAEPAQSTVRESASKERIGRTLPSTLIIVIDDAGYQTKDLKPFLALPFPLTIAVLPGLAHSRDAANMTAEAGKELILHQPMEALGGQDPGPHAVFLSMDDAAIERTVRENIESLPFIPAGMNNHMGSAVTRDKRAMAIILKLAKEYGMYYLDSLTTNGTVTAELGKQIGIPHLERHVFLDNKSDRESIIAAIEEGKKIARSNGAAVMIGHVWSAQLASTLMELYPQLVEEGYSLSTISQYMQMEAEAQAGYESSGN